MENGARKSVGGNLKGRVAEGIIEQMFRRSRREIYFLGIEWRQLCTGANGDVTFLTKIGKKTVKRNRFKKPPDFLVVTLDRKFEYVEVRFRDGGWPFLGFKDAGNDDIEFFRNLGKTEGPDFKVLWLSQHEMKVVVHPFWGNGGLVTQSVAEQTSWGIQPEVFKECLHYLKIFGTALVNESKE